MKIIKTKLKKIILEEVRGILEYSRDAQIADVKASTIDSFLQEFDNQGLKAILLMMASDKSSVQTVITALAEGLPDETLRGAISNSRRLMDPDTQLRLDKALAKILDNRERSNEL